MSSAPPGVRPLSAQQQQHYADPFNPSTGTTTYADYFFIVAAFAAVVLSFVLPHGSSTSSFVCPTLTGVSTTTHTFHIVHIPAIVSIIYLISCARNIYAQHSAPSPPSGVSITFISAFLIIPIIYHSGIRCVPDILAIFVIYASTALYWHSIRTIRLRYRPIIIIFILSALKLTVVISKILVLHHLAATTWVFIIVDAFTIILHTIVNCITVGMDDDTQMGAVIARCVSHIQLICLIAISLYAAACID